MTTVGGGHYIPDAPTARHDIMPSVSQPIRSVCTVKSAPNDKTSPGRFVLNTAVPSIAASSRVDKHGNVVIDTQHFYITHHHEAAEDRTEEVCFAGSLDRYGKNQPTRIVSDKGSVRGVKNRVRAGIETFREKDGAQCKVGLCFNREHQKEQDV